MGAALTFAVLTASACSSSKSSGGAAPATTGQSPADANANENDVQILNSLQLTGAELDTAFATDPRWQPWTGYDPAKALIKQAQACTAGIIDTKEQALQPVTVAFKADQLTGDQAPAAPSSPASAAKSSSGKKGTSAAPSTSASAPTDQNPTHWVVSTAIAYKSSDAAHSAVSGMGKVDQNTVGCGGPSDRTAIVGGGIGEIGPSWDDSQGVFVYADTKTNTSVAVVAQRRGRYVVLTYTRGGAKPQTGYYDLEAGPDTSKAADAATEVLGQLTNAVVNRD
ncbi:hypothetical protein [Catenulispora subtropica]|uniref:Lipoprotein n=1 Tax=Catenulispora subtropica TaxID=450798 RepID=A0ABP5C7K7_9ACTN